MKIVVIFMLFAAVTATPTPKDLFQEEWKEFKLIYNKNYQSEDEEIYRMKIFADSKARVAKFNQAYSRGEQTFKTGINQFSDMTLEEFNNKMNGFRPKPRNTQKINAMYMLSNIKPPKEIDWRKKGAVTQVKNQQLCASCWSFSATGALESQFFKKHHRLISLSEQNLIDCSGFDTIYKNYGCLGGDVRSSFLYVHDNGGIDDEKSYPYEASENICRYSDKTNSGVKDKNYTYIIEGDEEDLKTKVAVYGPVSVGIYANTNTFKDYTSGIFYQKDCFNGYEYLNHAMLVVGYGTDKYSRMDYWIVKNAFGTTWGEKGYIRIARNRNNQCGIATAGIIPVLS